MLFWFGSIYTSPPTRQGNWLSGQDSNLTTVTITGGGAKATLSRFTPFTQIVLQTVAIHSGLIDIEANLLRYCKDFG